MYRGSRKHVLDWVERPSFPTELLNLIDLPGIELPTDPVWTPRGYRLPNEARFEDWGPRGFGPHPAWEELGAWWLVHRRGANTPNWDIAMPLVIEGRRGLFLCEAKANEDELDIRGKSAPSASTASHANDERIGAAIDEARVGLVPLAPSLRIDRDTHYQLSNRIAFMWKLATLRLPVVLMYLGFTGDEGLDRQKPFHSAAHWDEVVGRYFDGVGARPLIGPRLSISGTQAYFISRCRPVLEPSGPSDFLPYGLPLKQA